MSDHFSEALKDMVGEAAFGGAVRHLWELGLDVKTIQDRLDFPASTEQIRQIIWKHCVNTAAVLLTEPTAGTGRIKTGYIKETDAYGRSSFRRIEEPIDDPSGKTEYMACDFGIRRARDEAAFMDYLSVLIPADRTYITDLPWPRQRVWHILDDRFRRICTALDI